jgi:hypothetical protein
MIIDVWFYKTIRNEKLYYYQVDRDNINKTGYKVRYTCDCSNCKSPNKIHVTMSSTLLRGGWNNLETQMCRSCRSMKSERIKGVIVPFDVIRNSVESEGYKMLSSPMSYEKSIYPSQHKIRVECSKGHIYNITWNNWSKGKRCRRCYEENKRNNALKYLKGFKLYKYLVLTETSDNYKRYKNAINPLNIKRNKYYHLDHRFSITEGFKHNIPPYIIGSQHNLEIVPSRLNEQKGVNCSITKEELFNAYFRKA